MNSRVVCGLVFLFLIAAAPRLHAQCTDLPPITVSCNGYHCQGQYSQPPDADGGPYDDTTNVIICCGHRVNVYAGGGGCTNSSLRSQVAREGLNLLRLDGLQVMVEDCRGHFNTPIQVGVDLGHWDNAIQVVWNSKG